MAKKESNCRRDRISTLMISLIWFMYDWVGVFFINFPEYVRTSMPLELIEFEKYFPIG